MAKNNKAKKQDRREDRRQAAATAAPGEETFFDPTSDYGFGEGKKGKPFLDTDLGEHAVTQNPEDYFNLLLAQGGVDPAGVTPYHQWVQNDGYNLTQTGYGAALLKNPKLSYQDYMQQAFRVPGQSEDYVPGPASPAPGTPALPAAAPPVAAAPPSFQQWMSQERGIGPRERQDLNNARRNRLQAAYQAQHSTPADTAADAAPPAPPSLEQFVQQQSQQAQQQQAAQQPFTPVDTGNPFTSQSAPVPGQQAAPPAQSAGVSQQRANKLKQHGKTNQLQRMRQQANQPSAPAAGPTPFATFMQNRVQPLGAEGVDSGIPNPADPSLGPMMGQLRKTFQSYTPEQRGTYMSGYSPGPARWAAYG